MHIGIDLGTTFCCVAYIDDYGNAKVIPNSDGFDTTPSVIWFDGKNAYVGKKANDRKETSSPQLIYEFVKRDMGKPAELSHGLHLSNDTDAIETAPYEINGFKYGADGMSAIILRKLKKEAIRYFKRFKKLDDNVEERDMELNAVITVPAYFGDKERQMTWAAGYAAGLNVIGIINEPTAAALTYGFSRNENSRILVFDLGGGTFDVTILEVRHNGCNVVASDGANTLGGKDWDEVIQQYIYAEFQRRNNREIPPDKGFDIQQKALKAKFDLSESEETVVTISDENGDTDILLWREAPKDKGIKKFDRSGGDGFYFDRRSSSLLSQCRTICKRIIESKYQQWGDIDDIILVGGACRMPMIGKMLEELTGKSIKRHIDGFSYDTAISIGAALYGQQKGLVKDVVSHSIGIKYVQDGKYLIDYLIKKNTHLPLCAERRYIGGKNAVLEVYEGESIHPDECRCRGRIPLYDIDGHVTIKMELDEHNGLRVIADYPPHRIEKKFEGEEINDQRLKELRSKVQSVVINL